MRFNFTLAAVAATLAATPAVAQQATTSPYLRQYNATKPQWVERPEQMPGSDLTNAFEPQ